MAVLLVAVLATVAIGRASGATAFSDEGSPAVYATVTVGPGESLWVIARDAAPAVDPRSTIAHILELNRLAPTDGVRVGQRLVVPVAR